MVFFGEGGLFFRSMVGGVWQHYTLRSLISGVSVIKICYDNEIDSTSGSLYSWVQF